MAQRGLSDAKNAKNDEFYTQYPDIEKEMNAYYEYDNNVFRDKTILLPCDDPEWSNFTKYFVANFNRLGIKKLISTSYAKSAGNKTTTEFEKKSNKYDAIKHEHNGKVFTLDRSMDVNGDGKIDIEDIGFDYLDGDGDFRSEEVTKLLEEADIVITNPPFSLFREFVAWIMKYDKQFIIIGNLNTVANKEIFPLFRANKIWLGSSYFNGGAAYFIAPAELYDPEKMSNQKNAYVKDGKFYWRVNGVRWYTNIEHGVRHNQMPLMTKADNLKFNKKLVKKLQDTYGVSDYPKYCNYDAIEIPYADAIPSDYDGEMGVPVSFVDKFCPEQFEIIGIGIGEMGKELHITPIPKEIDAILSGHSSVWRLYIMNGDKPIVPFSRIIIKHKKADHVTAWSKGGLTDISNCEMLCKSHNRGKGNR